VRRMVWFVGVLLKPLLKTRRDRECKEGRQTNCQISNSGVEGAFGLPQKFPEISKYN